MIYYLKEGKAMEKEEMKRYSREFRMQVAKEALLPYNEGLEHVIAEKYKIKPWTVVKWKECYLEQGDEAFRKGFSKRQKKTSREIELEKENAALKEEVEILKKAAAFLAAVKRE